MKKYNLKVTPWQVAEQDFPKDGTLEEKFIFLLRYAILAPSDILHLPLVVGFFNFSNP